MGNPEIRLGKQLSTVELEKKWVIGNGQQFNQNVRYMLNGLSQETLKEEL